MRAVVDVNVLISGVLSAKGPSAEILRASRDGLFELVISAMLLTELNRTVRYPRLRKRIPPEKANAYVSWIREHGALSEDPNGPPPVGSRDPDDDYLLAVAIDRRAYLVTGDQDLLVLSDDLPRGPRGRTPRPCRPPIAGRPASREPLVAAESHPRRFGIVQRNAATRRLCRNTGWSRTMAPALVGLGV